MACSNVKESLCPKVDCANHAQCCACVENHRKPGGLLPFCLRPKTAEEKK